MRQLSDIGMFYNSPTNLCFLCTCNFNCPIHWFWVNFCYHCQHFPAQPWGKACIIYEMHPLTNELDFDDFFFFYIHSNFVSCKIERNSLYIFSNYLYYSVSDGFIFSVHVFVPHAASKEQPQTTRSHISMTYCLYLVSSRLVLYITNLAYMLCNCSQFCLDKLGFWIFDLEY